jgi:hypothetical protein
MYAISKLDNFYAGSKCFKTLMAVADAVIKPTRLPAQP